MDGQPCESKAPTQGTVVTSDWRHRQDQSGDNAGMVETRQRRGLAAQFPRRRTAYTSAVRYILRNPVDEKLVAD